MRFRGVAIGVIAGLLIGIIVGMVRASLMQKASQPVPLAEDHGRIARVEMQYKPAADNMVIPIYQQFLSAIGKTVEVIWTVGEQSDLAELKEHLGASWPEGHSRALVINKEISTWAKDRFVALVTADGQFSVACAPERAFTPNPLHTNDQEVPFRLAKDMPDLFRVRGTSLTFDGGDFLATDRHLFVGPAVIQKNPVGPGGRFSSVKDMTNYLSTQMGRQVTWVSENLADTPDHHLGMYLTVMGKKAAVGDVTLAEAVLKDHPDLHTALQPGGGVADAVFRNDLSRRLDFVARKMQDLGYTVVRVPLLPSMKERAWMSYNNGIVETRGSETIFYMPTFGVKELDHAAADCFTTEMGCRVVPIDCSGIWQLGGSLHCLVNVVARTP